MSTHLDQDVTEDDVRIVAIGASAGGLDPLEQFFEAMPATSGVAFVVIQHLAPDFRSMMNELLARHSTMPIHKVEDGMEVEANTIYLNPPRHDMRVENGKFILLPASQVGALNLPINAFFTSLAQQFGGHAIGIVLSGTGSDGSEGCLAIKSAGGGVFVQEPSTAKFDSMPLGVINQDIADAVADPQTLAHYLVDYLNGDSPRALRGIHKIRMTDPFAMIFHILRERYGADFSYYKRATIERRIKRRCNAHSVDDLMTYIDLLSVDPNEVSALYNDLLIDVTEFFRDQEAFDLVSERAIGQLVAKMSAETPLRIWVPGCSTGEEAYSIAILVAEHARKNTIPLNLKVLATDLHARSLDAAGSGVYDASAVKNVDPDIVKRYFEADGNYYQIKGFIRKLVVFSQHNIIKDPPFTKIDLVSCRNLLIYLNDLAQQKALALFHFALCKDGFLFLGPSETVGKLDSEFRTIDQRWRLFQKIRDVRLVDSTTLLIRNGLTNPDNMPGSDGRPQYGIPANRTETRRAYNDALKEMLTRYAPAGFLLSVEGELSHIFGDANRLLKLEPGSFNRRITELLPQHLRVLVASGLERMKATSFTPFRRSMPIETEAGKVTYSVRLEGLPDADGQVEFLLLTIEETQELIQEPGGAAPDIEITPSETSLFLEARVQELERDLQSTEESLQTTIEELETSNEELQATNEELMASNEELQSTNEELHSVNEELYTVSAEHQRKIEELVELTSDMDHLLKATDIGTVFLGSDLEIRRFTPAATRTFNLIPQDIGRPISHVTAKFNADGFLTWARSDRDLFEDYNEYIVVEDRHYLFRVLPYLNEAEASQGMVITIVDIDLLKRAESEIETMASRYDQVLTDIPQVVMCWRASDGQITYANEHFSRLAGFDRKVLLGEHVSRLGDWPGNPVRIDIKKVENLQPGQTCLFHSQYLETGGQETWWDITCRALGSGHADTLEYMATATDVTGRVSQEQALKALSSIDIKTLRSTEDLADKVLTIGSEYFGLRCAYFARISEDQHSISHYSYANEAAQKIIEAKERDLKSTPCSEVVAKDAVVAFSSPEEASSGKRYLIDGQPVHAFIGGPVHLNAHLVGVLSFLDFNHDRVKPFSDIEKDFMQLLVRWFELMAEHVEQSQKLRKNERELKLIFDNVPSRIWYKDDKNRILRINETAARSMGLTVEEAEGAETQDLFPEMAEKYHADDLEVINSGKAKYGIIEKFTPRGGTHGWSSTDKIPYTFNEDDERAVLVVSTDVTDLKEREIELARVNTELDLQKRSYEDLYKRTPVMMHSIDNEGNIVEVSDTWLEKLGYDREEVIGHQSTLFLTEASQKHAKDNIISDFWEKGYCTNVQYQFIRKDGSLIDVELSGIIDRKQGQPERTLAVLVDVTDRNEAFVALEKANSDLAYANDGLKKFAYIASHDLQEPLRKIQQFGDMLFTEYGDKLEGDASFYMDVMQNAASRMRRLIRDLLSFSKASNAEIQREELPLSQIAKRAVADLDERIREAGAKITIEKLPSVRGDEAMTLQLMTNLLSNAVKYHKSGEKPAIVVSPLSNGAGAGFCVTDNGLGIPQEDQARIFDAFSRLHTQSEVDGSGIGLAICQTVCDRQGWSISVDSCEGEGTRFKVICADNEAARE